MNSKNTFAQTCVCCLGIGLVSLLTAPVTLAQTLTTPGSALNEPVDLGGVLNGNTGTGGGSLLNLVNQLRLMDGRNPAEVTAEQQENLNSAAEMFRRKQQQQLQQPAVTTPAPEAQPVP